VLLNKPQEQVHYFVMPGRILIDEPDRFGKDYCHPTMPGIHPKCLAEFRDKWDVFDQNCS
jgi:hypothetical protein